MKSFFSMEKLPPIPSKSEIKILKALLKEDKLNEKTLSERTKLSIGNISKSLKRLSDVNGIGLIYFVKDIPNFYGINPLRRFEIEKIITGIEYGKKNKKKMLYGHAMTYEVEIKEIPKEFLNSLKKGGYILFKPNSWEGIKKKSIDNTIMFHKTSTDCKVIFYIRTFGTDPKIIEMVTIEKLTRLISNLEEKYLGLKLGGYKQTAICKWTEYAYLLDPISTLTIKMGLKLSNKMEDSLKIGGEWEEKGINAVENIKKIISFREILLKLSPKGIDQLLENANNLIELEAKSKLENSESSIPLDITAKQEKVTLNNESPQEDSNQLLTID